MDKMIISDQHELVRQKTRTQYEIDIMAYQARLIYREGQSYTYIKDALINKRVK